MNLYSSCVPNEAVTGPNPHGPPSFAEMTLRQFGSVGEVLVKLKADLESAFPSFFREFLSSKAATNGENGGGSTNGGGGGSAGSEDADDGVTLLLDLLKAIQV